MSFHGIKISYGIKDLLKCSIETCWAIINIIDIFIFLVTL